MVAMQETHVARELVLLQRAYEREQTERRSLDTQLRATWAECHTLERKLSSLRKQRAEWQGRATRAEARIPILEQRLTDLTTLPGGIPYGALLQRIKGQSATIRRLEAQVCDLQARITQIRCGPYATEYGAAREVPPAAPPTPRTHQWLLSPDLSGLIERRCSVCGDSAPGLTAECPGWR